MINLYLGDLQHMDMEDVVAELLTAYVELSQKVKTLNENRRTAQVHYMQHWIKPDGNLDTDFTNLLGITEVQHGAPTNTSTFYLDGVEYHA
jgi:hypothetical protein